MTAPELLRQLTALDIRLRVEGEGLRYDAPEGALTADLRELVRLHKSELIRILAARATEPAIPVARGEGPLPLAFAQQRLWFLDRWEQDRAGYHIPLAWLIAGPLQVEALHRSLRAIVHRHEALRSTFPLSGGVPVQRIAPPGEFPFPLVELRDAAAPENEVRAIEREEAARPFDLSSGPLIRATLVRLGPEQHELLVTVHHIVFDGWSVAVFLRELAILYAAFARGREPDLAPLPFQFADYCCWQQDALKGATMEGHLSYWRSALQGIPDRLLLPVDHPYPKVQTFLGAFATHAFGAGLTQEIKSLSQRSGATVYISLLAAFATLLQRYTGQDDIVLGSPTANRNIRGTEALVGFFANTLALRCDLSGDPTFQELLTRVRDSAMGAYAHQDLPFERLVEELQPERDLGYSPLVQALFVWQPGAETSLQLGDLTVTMQAASFDRVRFDLEIHISDGPGGLGLAAIYNRDLFERATIERLLNHYESLLEIVASAPHLRLSEIEFLAAEEITRLRQLSADSGPSVFPEHACIHELFDAQAQRTPDNICAISGGTQFTFHSLRVQSNRIAHYLLERGIAPGDRVDLPAEPSCEAVAGLLGILKAGATFVPLNLADPRAHSVDVKRLLHVNQLDVNQDFSGHNGDSPAIPVADDSLACVLHAGQVTLEHRTIRGRLNWLQRTIGLASPDALLQSTPWDREAGIWEILWPLVAGARVVFPNRGETRNVIEVRRLIAKHSVSVIHLPPTLASSLAATRGPDLNSLREVLCSGELPPGPRLPVPHRFLFSLPEAAGPVLADGMPAGISVSLLDAASRPAPLGATGEICIGNPPFRTGQSGRRNAEGAIALAGPLDRRVWLDGFRIDLEEIERAILTNPAIAECRVTARGGVLIAYVVLETRYAADQLTVWLADLLPAHLIPAAFVPVSSLPLNGAGHVDDRALAKFPVLEPDVIQKWEKRLLSAAGVGQAAVVVQERPSLQPVLHVSDLLPDWTPAALNAPGGATESAPKPAEPHLARQAFSDGGPLVQPSDAPRTLTEALLRTAGNYPAHGITYVRADGSDIFETYPKLVERAKRALTGLTGSGLRAGDAAILQIHSLEDHFAVFWACVLGGIRPVTVAAPASYEKDQSVVAKLINIWELLGHPPVLASDSAVEPLRALRSDLKIVPAGGLFDNAIVRSIHESTPDDIVFLQLTSGSTGIPKCIQETHRGIVAHIHGSAQFNRYTPHDVTVNWLPMDHVVPILTFHCKDVYLGCSQVHAPTALILAEPLRWLDLIGKHRATHTWAPNFGFKLVSSAIAGAPNRRWDLSSLKLLMNAGEQVTVPVVEEFLSRTKPFGVAPQAMQPAFGMAEVCTCMTYRNGFSIDSGVHTVGKSPIVDLGPPIPGVQIRIADARNQVVEEGVVGRLQIRGEVLTPGYLNNPEANREAFVGDGWFNSGDLGFIRDGCLSITGREKELIVINGANYYCYEIEDVVNGIDGVEQTFVAACGIGDPQTGTEALAIFFSPKVLNPLEEIRLIKAIRTRVTSGVGLNPSFVVCVEKQDFPKTTSGKIQRTKLRNQLLAGHFNPVLKRADLGLRNANVLPDWFFRKVWPRKESLGPAIRGSSSYLILPDNGGLARALSDELKRLGHSCTFFPRDEGIPSGQTFDEILHLGSCDRAVGLDAALESGLYSVLSMIRRLAASENSALRFTVVSRGSQDLPRDRQIAYPHSALHGLVKTIPQELSWLSARHIDLPLDPDPNDLPALVREIRTAPLDREVALRAGRRYVTALKKLRLDRTPADAPPFRRNGIYLITGGLGGIGLEVSRYLLRTFDARLILIGRTPPQSRAAELKSLENIGGEVIYRTLDVSDLPKVRELTAKATERWAAPLDGIIHLAGIFREKMLAEETREGMADLVNARMRAAAALVELLDDRPDKLFIAFSSVNGFFGGVTAGAYAAAASFMEGFTAHVQRATRIRTFLFGWSLWDQIGMSRDYVMKELSRARGYYSLPVEQAMLSFTAGLRRGQTRILIGLDGENPHIRRFVRTAASPTGQLAGFLSATSQIPDLDSLRIPDRFQTATACRISSVREMPLTPDGKIDRAALAATAGHPEGRRHAGPRTEIEIRLAAIWRDLLRAGNIGAGDNFFELGGHSLLATRLVFEIRKAFGVEFPLQRIIQAPTLEGMALWIESNFPSSGRPVESLPDCVVPLQVGGSRPPLFCVHPAGGSPVCYAELVRHLGPEQPFYGFQSAGLLEGGRPLTSVEDLAAAYLEGMRKVLPAGPWLIAGWSSGGPVAFEMARQMEAAGVKAALVVLLDSGLRESSTALERLRAVWKQILFSLGIVKQIGVPRRYAELQYLGQMIGVGLPASPREIFRHGPVQTGRFLRRFLYEVARSLRVVRANVLADRNYNPRPLDARSTVILFGVSPGDPEPEMVRGLRRFSNGGVDVFTVPGNHMLLLDSANLGPLAEQLRECIDRAAPDALSSANPAKEIQYARATDSDV